MPLPLLAFRQAAYRLLQLFSGLVRLDEAAVLRKLFILVMSQFLGHIGGDSSGIFQHFSFIEFEKCVQLGNPFLHVHDLALPGLHLREIKILADQ